MANFDLDESLPDGDTVSFSVDGIKYSIKLMVSFSVGVWLLENYEDIKSILPVKIDRTNGTASIKFEIKPQMATLIPAILREMMKDQYPDITDEWIKKNISLPRIGVIFLKSILPIFRYLKSIDMGDLIGESSEKH